MERRDFFISYTEADRAWAEWVAWQLESSGYSVFLQAWDFAPGENFIERMYDVLEQAERTIALISRAYLASHYCRDEWTSAFLHDEDGRSRLLQARIEDCQLPRLLRTRAYVDLVGLSVQQARTQLLNAVRQGRRKPVHEPVHPNANRGDSPRFPGGESRVSNIPPRNTVFSGRSAHLRQLHRFLRASPSASAQSATIYGLGGIGKTQLALEYAHRYGSEYQIIWWVPSEVPMAIPEVLFGLARKLGLAEVQHQSEMLDALWDELSERDHWLLVYDNAENARSLAPYRPRSGGGSVLITSRTPSWGGAATIELGVLRQDEALSFLRKRIGGIRDGDKEVLSDLATTLGGLPLALEQAASYMDETRVSPTEYLQTFHEHGAELLAVESTTTEQTVAATWRVALDRIRRQTPAALDLLNLCAFLHPESIPKDLLTGAPQGLPEGLRKPFSRGFAFNHLLATIHRYSLIQLSQKTLAMHRLVQTVIRSGLTQDEAKEWAARAVILTDISFPSGGSDAGLWEQCGALLPHALEAIENAKELGVEARTSGLLLSKVATFLWARSELPQARRLLEQSLALERSGQGDDLAIASRLNDLGLVLWDMGQLGEAQSAHEQALEIRRQRLGSEHSHLAASLNNLGAVLCDLEVFDRARTVLERSLLVWKRAGAHVAVIALSLSNIGVALRGLGELRQAEAILHDSLKLWDRLSGATRGTVPDTEHSGAFTDELGHLAEERAYCERDLPGTLHSTATDAAQAGALVAKERRDALEWARSTGQHPAAATTVDNLGTVLAQAGELSEARRLLFRGLGIRRLHLGNEHPDVAWSLNNLAVVVADMGQTGQARAMLEEVLEIRESRLGPDHLDVATCLGNLATVLADLGDTVGSRAMLQRALRIREEKLSPEHPATERVRARLLALEHTRGGPEDHRG